MLLLKTQMKTPMLCFCSILFLTQLLGIWYTVLQHSINTESIVLDSFTYEHSTVIACGEKKLPALLVPQKSSGLPYSLEFLPPLSIVLLNTME